MTLGLSGSRKVSVARSSANVAIACSIIFAAPALMAEDELGKQPAKESRMELLQAIESEPAQTRESHGQLPRQTGFQTRPTFDDLDTAASGLNDALDGARSKLNQLREAADIAAIAAALRDELEAAAEENNRLAVALTKTEANQRSLEASLEKSNDQIGTLTKDLGEARSEAKDLAQELRDSREKTKTTDVARAAAVERAERSENQLAASQDQNQGLSQENKALKDRLNVARAERDDARIETEVTREERDIANQELDTIRIRIASLLRSVLHADETVDAAMSPGGAVPAKPEATVAEAKSDSAAYEIVQTSNIRAEPHRDADRVDIGVVGEKVSVLRKVPDDNWFEVKTVRGTVGYIFGELIEPAS